MEAADYVVDFGPGPGARGGHVVATGTPADIANERNSITGAYLAGRSRIEIPATRRPINNAAKPRAPARPRRKPNPKR